MGLGLRLLSIAMTFESKRYFGCASVGEVWTAFGLVKIWLPEEQIGTVP